MKSKNREWNTTSLTATVQADKLAAIQNSDQLIILRQIQV